jgi:16S rRNA (guanine527-N7)-methyltransferase
MTPQDFASHYNVSRETLDRLEIFAACLTRWNARINLMSPKSLPHLWQRHIADSAQLWALAPPNPAHWADLGSGAGLPGLVIAALAAEATPDCNVTLVESDTRKAAFLATAAREMGLSVTIHAKRIDAIPRCVCSVISARALAPLPALLAHADRLALPGVVLLLPKGARVDSELTDAAASWHIEHEKIPSQTDPEGVILRIWEFKPRHAPEN